MSSSHYDVIIIGSGAGGGTLFHRLAPSGKRILLLERGDYVPRETDNWSTRAVNVEGKYQTKEHWRDKDGKDLHPHINYWVGGNTKFYGAALFRLRRETSASSGITAASPRRGRSSTGSSSPTTRKLSTFTRCTANAVPIRPSLPPVSPTSTQPSATSRESSS